jgi:DNA-binding response OmpR family regulator
MAYKLLLADDSQTIQKVVELVLNPEGFDIMAYGNGEDAIKALVTAVPDVVLADVEMPKVNGYQLCEKVKGSPSTKHVPVILLAGAFEPFDEDYAKSVGADDYILKPFESHELISKIKALLIEQAEALPIGEAPSYTELPQEPVAAEAVQETEWFESFPMEQKETATAKSEESEIAEVPGIATGAKAFDEELLASMKAIGQEKAEEMPEVEEVSIDEALPQEMSIDEISKLVKEAIGEAPEAAAVIQPEVESREAVHAPVLEHMSKDSVQYLAGLLKDDINAAVRQGIGEMVTPILKDTVVHVVSGMLPKVLEETMSASMREISSSLQSAVNDEIKRVVPDLAETIIKREIEKITSELA